MGLFFEGYFIFYVGFSWDDSGGPSTRVNRGVVLFGGIMGDPGEVPASFGIEERRKSTEHRENIESDRGILHRPSIPSTGIGWCQNANAPVAVTITRIQMPRHTALR